MGEPKQPIPSDDVHQGTQIHCLTTDFQGSNPRFLYVYAVHPGRKLGFRVQGVRRCALWGSRSTRSPRSYVRARTRSKMCGRRWFLPHISLWFPINILKQHLRIETSI